MLGVDQILLHFQPFQRCLLFWHSQALLQLGDMEDIVHS
jgi:hypothetical protein